MDFKSYDNEQLDELRREVATEQERRANLDRIPAQMAEQKKLFIDGGGDPEVLEQALSGQTESHEPSIEENT